MQKATNAQIRDYLDAAIAEGIFTKSVARKLASYAAQHKGDPLHSSTHVAAIVYATETAKLSPRLKKNAALVALGVACEVTKDPKLVLRARNQGFQEGVDQIQAELRSARRQAVTEKLARAAATAPAVNATTPQTVPDALREFQAMIDRYVSERGLSKPKAVAAVVQDHPHLQEQLIREANGSRTILTPTRPTAATRTTTATTTRAGDGPVHAFEDAINAAMRENRRLNRTGAIEHVRRTQPAIFHAAMSAIGRRRIGR